MKKRFLVTLVGICALIMLMAPLAAAGTKGFHHHGMPEIPKVPIKLLEAGDVWVVEENTRLSKLVIAEGAVITAPEDHILTMTVNGVETGQALVTTAGVDTAFVPGTYCGNIVLTVAEVNPVLWIGMGPPGAPAPEVTFPFRQALYLDEDGVDTAKSVLSAVVGKKFKKSKGSSKRNILIRSDGECFNGIYAAGGTQTIRNAKIDFLGNGRSDFAGYGTAVMSTGENTKLVLDRVRIVTEGVVRTAAIADHGSNLIVKNSHLQTYDGVLPVDYMPTIDMLQMRSVPWMLSLSGNCRATNLLGINTKATYINSYIGSEGWGVLSTDGCITPRLTAINSTIANTGEDGYGSYGIGDAIEEFLGCTFNVATYAMICRDAFVSYGDSDPARVEALNEELDLGLSPKELRRIKKQPTIVNSKRFGIMWHGGGEVDIRGGTVFNTGKTTFLNKGQAIVLTVDGFEGAQLNPGNGVILQVMDDDDPGPQPPFMYNTGIYDEPTGPVILQPGHDIYDLNYGPNMQGVIVCTDAQATFSNIELAGDFYNGMRGDVPGPFGPPSPRNMALTFENASITGVISASTTTHILPHIEYPIGWDGINGEPFINVGHTEDYKMLGEVTNTPSETVNNGVIVSLDADSKWTITGTCYLTKLIIEDGALVTAPDGYSVIMTVDGFETPIVAGTYSGEIVLTVE